MNKEIDDALCMLLHCSLKDKKYTTQKEQADIIRRYIINLKQALKQRDEVIEEAIDMLNLIIPELWNINNHMTYKLQDIRRTLNKYKGDNNDRK